MKCPLGEYQTDFVRKQSLMLIVCYGGYYNEDTSVSDSYMPYSTGTYNSVEGHSGELYCIPYDDTGTYTSNYGFML